MSKWRVGRKLGRTIYKDDVVVGLVDTPELAAEIVARMNLLEPDPLLADIENVNDPSYDENGKDALDRLASFLYDQFPVGWDTEGWRKGTLFVLNRLGAAGAALVEKRVLDNIVLSCAIGGLPEVMSYVKKRLTELEEQWVRGDKREGETT